MGGWLKGHGGVGNLPTCPSAITSPVVSTVRKMLRPVQHQVEGALGSLIVQASSALLEQATDLKAQADEALIAGNNRDAYKRQEQKRGPRPRPPQLICPWPPAHCCSQPRCFNVLVLIGTHKLWLPFPLARTICVPLCSQTVQQPSLGLRGWLCDIFDMQKHMHPGLKRVEQMKSCLNLCLKSYSRCRQAALFFRPNN